VPELHCRVHVCNSSSADARAPTRGGGQLLGPTDQAGSIAGRQRDARGHAFQAWREPTLAHNTMLLGAEDLGGDRALSRGPRRWPPPG
jgi:hypothetical protein